MANPDPMAARAAELIDDELKSREDKIINRVMRQLDQGEEVTGDQALQAWMQIQAMRQLKKGLEIRGRKAVRDNARKAVPDE